MGDLVTTSSSRPVGFVIAGVQKAGTTTLYGSLRVHPQVARSKLKELHFFDDDSRDWAQPDYAAYERGIAANPAALIAGEASPSYLFWPGAMARMHAYNPDMRVILSFRDPIDRAFSQWCMNRGRNPAHPEFADAIRAFAPLSLPPTLEEAGGRILSYLARGYYGAQVARALDHFDRGQLLCLDFHRAFSPVSATMDDMTDFLGLARFDPHPVPKQNRARPAGLTGAAPTGADIAFLADRLAPDLADFARLTGLDVSGWPTASVVSGATHPDDLAAKLAGKANLVSA